MSLDCLNNIIGLSDTGCTCWDASKPGNFAELNASSSGLYVMAQNTLPVNWTNSASDCENGGVWDLAAKARSKAVSDLVHDFLTDVQKSRNEQFRAFSKIGHSYSNSGEIVNSTVAAAWIEPYRIKGGKLNITSIDLAFFSGIVSSTPVTIEIYSSLDFSTILGTAVATITANKIFATATFLNTVVIDLGNIRRDLNERIYFAYTIPTGAKPVSNETYIRPCCSQSVFKDNPYLQILVGDCGGIGGVQSSSVANLASAPMKSTSTMQGMVINASMYCDYLTWLCDLAQRPNALGGQQHLNLGGALADGLQMKSLINLIDAIKKSSRVNFQTMLPNLEILNATQDAAWPVYWLAIKNLSYHMPPDISDCLVCTKSKLVTKGEILVTRK